MYSKGVRTHWCIHFSSLKTLLLYTELVCLVEGLGVSTVCVCVCLCAAFVLCLAYEVRGVGHGSPVR